MFFDNASTTKIDDEIIDRLSDFNNEYFYNPGALYADGLKSKNKLEEQKMKIFLFLLIILYPFHCPPLNKIFH